MGKGHPPGLDNLMSSNYSTTVFEERVEAILQNHQDTMSDTPLFLYVAHNAPHSPHDAPNETTTYFRSMFLEDEGDGKGRKQRASFAACVRELDSSIERLMKKLESGGVYDNSFVLFLSDNGAMPGKTGGGSNYPLRGGKVSVGNTFSSHYSY